MWMKFPFVLDNLVARCLRCTSKTMHLSTKKLVFSRTIYNPTLVILFFFLLPLTFEGSIEGKCFACCSLFSARYFFTLCLLVVTSYSIHVTFGLMFVSFFLWFVSACCSLRYACCSESFWINVTSSGQMLQAEMK